MEVVRIPVPTPFEVAKAALRGQYWVDIPCQRKNLRRPRRRRLAEQAGDDSGTIGGDYLQVPAKTLRHREYDNVEFRIITGTRTYASEQTDGIALVPQNFALEQNYPNPFNPTTTIYYDLPKFSHVTLTVYNLTGREVATLVSANQPSGHYAITWDATSFASGVYVYQLQAGAYSETRKMLFLK